MSKSYKIYASQALDDALSERLPHGNPDGGGLRTRTATVTAMCDRYRAIIQASMPLLTLPQWLLIFDSLNGCWMQDQPELTALGVSANVADNCALNQANTRFNVPDWHALAIELDAMTLAEQLAIVDAAERFWILDIQTDDSESTDDDPFACWRAPIRGLVGRLADDPTEDRPLPWQPTGFCTCPSPDHGEQWMAVGGPGNVMDYQVCDTCHRPIQGTQTTHADDDDRA